MVVGGSQESELSVDGPLVIPPTVGRRSRATCPLPYQVRTATRRMALNLPHQSMKTHSSDSVSQCSRGPIPRTISGGACSVAPSFDGQLGLHVARVPRLLSR